MLTVYTRPDCTKCPHVKKFLTSHGIPFEAVDLTEHQDIAQNIYKLTGVTSVPITTNGTDYVIGLDYGKLRELNA